MRDAIVPTQGLRYFRVIIRVVGASLAPTTTNRGARGEKGSSIIGYDDLRFAACVRGYDERRRGEKGRGHQYDPGRREVDVLTWALKPVIN
jgi:hypothetical protein